MTKSEMRVYANKYGMTISDVRKLVRKNANKGITNNTPIKVYHYTKGYHMESIIADGFIAREGERGKYESAQFDPIWDGIDNLVWLTQSNDMPRCAMPTLINKEGQVVPDAEMTMEFASETINGAFRFVFDSTHPNLVKYFYHSVRNQLRAKGMLSRFDARNSTGGVNVRDFWVSNERLQISGVKIEKWVDGVWTIWEPNKQHEIDIAA